MWHITYLYVKHIVLQVIDFYYRFLLDIGYTGFFGYRLGILLDSRLFGNGHVWDSWLEHRWLSLLPLRTHWVPPLSPSPSQNPPRPAWVFGQRWFRVTALLLALEAEHPLTLASLSLPQTQEDSAACPQSLPQDFLKTNEIKSTKPSLFLGEQGDEGKRREEILLN